MFGIRRITLSCWENASRSTKSLYFPKIWGGHGPFDPPGYAYVFYHCSNVPEGNNLMLTKLTPVATLVLNAAAHMCLQYVHHFELRQ